MMMGYGFGIGGGLGGLLWGLAMMAVVVGLVVIVVWALGRATSSSSAQTGQGDALEVLRARFARGEISETDFVAAKRTLGYER